MIYGTVMSLGDSLTFGARSEYVRGYPEELAQLLSNHFLQEWSCLNHGVNGEISIDILRRAFPAIHSFASLPGAKWACLMAGTNDSKNPEYPVELYQDNMAQIIRIFKRYNIKTILGLLPPVKGDCMPCFDTIKSNQWIDSANLAIRELAMKNNLRLADFTGLGEFLVDGVHLNYAGYCEMAKIWFEKITEE